jgi:hypothetical protein
MAELVLIAVQKISPKNATPKGKKGTIVATGELEMMKNGDCGDEHKVGFTSPAPQHSVLFCNARGDRSLQRHV